MNQHLRKAKDALAKAAELSEALRHRDPTHANTIQMQHDYMELTTIAQIQANVAQAEALGELVDILRARLP